MTTITAVMVCTDHTIRKHAKSHSCSGPIQGVILTVLADFIIIVFNTGRQKSTYPYQIHISLRFA